MSVAGVLARPIGAIRNARISAYRDRVRGGIWGAALGLAVAAALLRHGLVLGAAATTWPAFLTLAVVIAAGLALDRLGLFPLLARLILPAGASDWLAAAGAIGFTALLSGLINLDVAVVVAVPVTLAVARERGLAGHRLAVAAALTANATSFLLPTSNLTTLLVLDHAPLSTGAYVRDNWIAWLLVTAVTVGALAAFVCAGSRRRADSAAMSTLGSSRRTRLSRLAPPEASSTTAATAPAATLGQAALALLDLVPMFVAAVAIRALLDGGILLGGSWLAQLAMTSGLAAGVNNLPAAAGVIVTGGASRWAAVLGLAIGPNLVLTGSVASLISRRIARDHGVGFGAARFSLLGAALLPLQMVMAVVGLHLTGAL
jgi:arsenical pump membrane protein